MSACESCWTDAHSLVRARGGQLMECYRRLYALRGEGHGHTSRATTSDLTERSVR